MMRFESRHRRKREGGSLRVEVLQARNRRKKGRQLPGQILWMEVCTLVHRKIREKNLSKRNRYLLHLKSDLQKDKGTKTLCRSQKRKEINRKTHKRNMYILCNRNHRNQGTIQMLLKILRENLSKLCLAVSLWCSILIKIQVKCKWNLWFTLMIMTQRMRL